jgi:diguanylate cyclase (GGDEF)-like protein
MNNVSLMPDRSAPVIQGALGDVGSEALLVFDASSGRLSFVNDAATALFGLRDETLADVVASDLLPEFANLAPRRFRARLPDGREVTVRLEALQAGAVAPFGAILAGVRIAAHAETALAPRGAAADGPPRSDRLESLWSLVVRRGFAGEEQIHAILAEAQRGIGLERATLARVDGDDLVVEFGDDGEAGAEPARLPIEATLAAAAVLRSGTIAVLDAASVPEFAAVAHGVRAFLAAAFRVEDVRYVLTFTGTAPRELPFDGDDWRYVDNVVEALSRGIERRASDERIERLAYSDALTALPNRIALLARLDSAIAEADQIAGRAAVLFLDIDGFKAVNDTVGHRGGDIVLAEIAQRLRGTIRREEYIGRLGGDEFAIVMPRIADRAEIESIAQRIGGVLTFPFAVEDYRFSLSASIGVAVYPDDATERDELLACADAAMYSAKDGGGSRIRFRDDQGFDDSALPAALGSEPRDIGYILCYQPILDARSGRVTAAEALIRRIHPLHGLLAPERGWSIARDEAGRRALDRWVLREATTQARAWHDAGMSLRIDVNLAAFDYREIDALLAEDRLARDVRRLRVEISPDLFVDAERREAVSEFLTHCAANGIGFALAGFDGGLGALGSLSNLPIDAVKLERPLVENVSASGTARAIVEGTVIVAKSLGWSVIAKGVETAAQQETVVALGCDGLQGFYIAHPMTAVDLTTWLRERRVAEHQA